MFIVLIHFKKPLAEVEPHVAEHRRYLDQGYRQNMLLVSGPMIPRVGGVLVSQSNDRARLEVYLANDPYRLHQVADHELIEFSAVKALAGYSSLIETTPS